MCTIHVSPSVPLLLGLQRVGWAIALLGPIYAAPRRIARAPAPARPPQTSAMAECISCAFVGLVADRRRALRADYMFALRARPRSAMSNVSRGPFAWASCASRGEYQAAASSSWSKHVEARRLGEDCEALDAAAERNAGGNVHARRHAKAATAMRRAAGPASATELGQAEKRCSETIK